MKLYLQLQDGKFIFKEFFAGTVFYIIFFSQLLNKTNTAGCTGGFKSAHRSPVQRSLNVADRCGTTLSRTNGIPLIMSEPHHAMLKANRF